jgi:hypothetical protein
MFGTWKVGKERLARSSDKTFFRQELWLLAACVVNSTSGCELVLGGIPSESELWDANARPTELRPDGGPTHSDDSQDPDSRESPDVSTSMDESVEMDGAGDGDGDGAQEPACSAATTWYADHDGDGYGTKADTQTGCPQPEGKWVADDGDCADDDPRVHPGQMAYFGEPYAGQAGNDSFDYDCSGNEDGDKSQALAPERCKFLTFPSCGGSGYAPTSRTGNALNSYCGSLTKEACAPSVAVVLCESSTTTVTEPYGCH